MNPTDEIKQRIDIVDLIQGYVPLTPGGANWKAQCPFHNEKSPSFMVSREKGIWHCFGCGKGGDIFSFIQEIEGMDFPEALHFLAQRAGVELRHVDPEQRSRRQRALEINALAAKMYHRVLLDHEKAEAARAYLAKRGITPETIETFQLGYAPETWEGVQHFLQGKKFTDEEIFHAGLTVKRDRGVGYYDRFRNRIMFPVHDHLGRVVGFSARALDGNQPGRAGSGSAGEPKYLNTPQTLIYNKSAVVYGLYQAKNAIKQAKLAILVEGNMDALASHQAGVTNVVAVSGTALTNDQLRLLKRYTEHIALSFDTDMAGESASMRGIERAWQEEMNIKVVTLPFGKDPDEVVQKNPEAWRKAVADAQPFMEYAFERVQKTLNLFSVEHKKLAAKRLLGLMAKLRDPIEQTHYLQKLSRLISVPEEILRGRLPKSAPTSVPSRNKDATQAAPPSEPAKNRVQRVAEQLLALASQSNEYMDYLVDHLEPEYLAPTNLLGLYKTMLAYYTRKHTIDQREFLQLLGREDQELAERANIIFLFGTSDLLPQEERLRKTIVLEGLSVLKRAYLQAELERLRQELADAERQGRRNELQALTERVTETTRQLADVQ